MTQPVRPEDIRGIHARLSRLEKRMDGIEWKVWLITLMGGTAGFALGSAGMSAAQTLAGG